MKKFTKINYILTFILVFCIGATLPILIGSSHVDEQHSAKSEVPYCVTSPTVPEQVTFDGETIDLRRYDRRERMDREMMAFTYMHSTTMLLIKRANRYFPIMPNTVTGWLYLPPIMPDKDEFPLNWTSNLPATQWTYGW